MAIVVDFQYREFFDVPREIVFEYDDDWFLLSSSFDADADEYEPEYTAYKLPDGFLVPESGWEDLLGTETERIGVVPVADVSFDVSRRSRLAVPRLVVDWSARARGVRE